MFIVLEKITFWPQNQNLLEFSVLKVPWLTESLQTDGKNHNKKMISLHAPDISKHDKLKPKIIKIRYFGSFSSLCSQRTEFTE